MAIFANGMLEKQTCGMYLDRETITNYENMYK